jgi:hypothetical protein
MLSHIFKRFERIVAEINAWLLAIAIGLATLDATVFVTLRMPALESLCGDCKSAPNSGEIYSGNIIPTAGSPLIMGRE